MHEYLSEHQKRAVEALEKLQSICSRHGITLYLLAGTTLGAVRHRGMIPWDDDIDVGFRYSDWKTLKNILPQELDGGFLYTDSDEKLPRLFGKILYDHQHCVDLFLIAKWTANSVAGFLHWQISRTAIEFYKFSLNYKTVLSSNVSFLFRVKFNFMRGIRKVFYIISSVFFEKEDYIRLARWNEAYYEHTNADYYINIYSIYNRKKEMLRAEWINEPSYVEFEGKQYLTVGDTDAYLKHLYGDYMTLPPEKERMGTHLERF